MVDCHNLDTVGLIKPRYPMFLKFEITDSIQFYQLSAVDKCFAIIDLASLFYSVPISTAFNYNLS